MLYLYLTLTLTLPSAYGEAKVQRLVLVTVSDSLANQIRYDMHYAKVSRALDFYAVENVVPCIKLLSVSVVVRYVEL